jgi:hypothetical protein
MAASTVNGTLVNPAQGALASAEVTFTLVDLTDVPQTGFDATDISEVIDVAVATPDPVTGEWSIELVPNASLQTGGTAGTAYRVVESSAGASSVYWIIVTATSPSWVGDLRTTSVRPDTPGSLPGTWCSVADVLTFTGNAVTQQDVNTAQGVLEGHIHRVWRPIDAGRRDYTWLQRATAWQAAYVQAHPEITTMMDVQSMSQDGLSVTFRSGTNTLPLIAPMARKFLDALFRGSNTTVRLNSAFQKNRQTRAGTGSGGSSPWSPM